MITIYTMCSTKYTLDSLVLLVVCSIAQFRIMCAFEASQSCRHFANEIKTEKKSEEVTETHTKLEEKKMRLVRVCTVQLKKKSCAQTHNFKNPNTCSRLNKRTKCNHLDLPSRAIFFFLFFEFKFVFSFFKILNKRKSFFDLAFA